MDGKMLEWVSFPLKTPSHLGFWLLVEMRGEAKDVALHISASSYSRKAVRCGFEHLFHGWREGKAIRINILDETKVLSGIVSHLDLCLQVSTCKRVQGRGILSCVRLLVSKQWLVDSLSWWMGFVCYGGFVLKQRYLHTGLTSVACYAFLCAALLPDDDFQYLRNLWCFGLLLEMFGQTGYPQCLLFPLGTGRT